MPPKPPLAKSELEVARIVWDLGTATVRQVVDRMPRRRDLDFKTVQTYLRRLEAKGYLHARREGRTNVYAPRVQPGKVIREVVGDLVDRLFDGETLPMVQHLIEDRGLNKDEIRQLRKMIGQLERESDAKSRR